MTSVFYEPVESVKEGESFHHDDDVGKSADLQGGEKLLVAMDESTSELLLVQPVDANEDDFSLRTSLVRK